MTQSSLGATGESRSSQVILDLATKLGQGLNVTHHLDYMRTDRATLYQLTCKQGF
jgi:hypothetical protein